MGIGALIEAVPPPSAPVSTFAGPWGPIEADLGLTLPADYKDFVRLYGHGHFLGFLGVNVPATANRYVHLTFSALMICNAHRGADGLPYPLWPEPGGLLPFGSTDNGDYLCWLTGGRPEEWSIVVWGRAFDHFQAFACDMTSFLAGLATGAIQPEDFPDDLLPCEHPFISQPAELPQAGAPQWRLQFRLRFQQEGWR